MKTPSSSSALKTLTQPDKSTASSDPDSDKSTSSSDDKFTSSSSSVKATASSSSSGKDMSFSSKPTSYSDHDDDDATSSSPYKAVSMETLFEGQKPYCITDIIATYDFLPSRTEYKFLRGIQGPIRLKSVVFKPDRDIITIIESSETLNQLPPLPPLAISKTQLVFKGETRVIGKLIYRENGNEIDCSKMGCMFFPRDTNQIQSMTTDGALFILLVSNYCVLHELAQACFPKRFPCIVLTVEGPPKFLIRMEKELNLPVLALVDSDPKSLKLLSFYGCRLKNLKWLGIRPTDMVGYKASTNHSTFHMTHKDIRTANRLLKDAYINNRPEWLYELRIMLAMKLKLVIETLGGSGMMFYLTDVFLPMKLQQQDWI